MATLGLLSEIDVECVVGLAKNERLKRIIGKQLREAKEVFEATAKAARKFKDFSYQTRKSWRRKRRVVGKGEHLCKGSNRWFAVTSFWEEEFDVRTLYEEEYCVRGEIENRIKEQQRYLFVDRTSAATIRANQLWL